MQVNHCISKPETIVVALGGNALGNTSEEQLRLVRHTAASIVDMVESGARVVVTHGNGPQVVDASKTEGASAGMPFPECGAMSQGYIGYHLSQAIQGELAKRGINRSAVNVVTQTVVDPDDTAFEHPTKPIGGFMTEEEAKALAAEKGYTVKEDAGRGWRRVVASPKPIRIVEIEAVKSLAEAGNIVIAAGGGGIPVIEGEDGYTGVAAVIDKDRTAALLATAFDADALVILTAVEKVYINYNKPNQMALDCISIEQAEAFIEEGQFAAGSMLPKVEACLDYLRACPQGRAVITSLERAGAGVAGETGTIITGRGAGEMIA